MTLTRATAPDDTSYYYLLSHSLISTCSDEESRVRQPEELRLEEFLSSAWPAQMKARAEGQQVCQLNKLFREGWAGPKSLSPIADSHSLRGILSSHSLISTRSDEESRVRQPEELRLEEFLSSAWPAQTKARDEGQQVYCQLNKPFHIFNTAQHRLEAGKRERARLHTKHRRRRCGPG